MTRAIAAVVLAGAVLSGTATAQAEPLGCPTGYTPDGAGCVARLTAVTADGTAGSLTGTPIGGTTPVTVFGDPGFYLPSAGFGSAMPDPVAQWDAAMASVGAMDPSGPGWYGDGKALFYLPRQLNDLATRMPSGTIMVRGVPDPTNAYVFELQSVQPVA